VLREVVDRCFAHQELGLVLVEEAAVLLEVGEDVVFHVRRLS